MTHMWHLLVYSRLLLLSLYPSGGMACSASLHCTTETLDVEPPAALPVAPVVRSITIGDYLITLNNGVTFKQVQARLGGAVVSDPATHEDSWAICYAAQTKYGRVNIRLMSDDLGVPEHEVLGFELTIRNSADPPRPGCTPTPIEAPEILIGGHALLGMTRLKFERTIGAPTRTSRGQSEYEHSKEVKGADGRIYDAYNRVLVQFARQRILRLSVWYVESS